MGEHTIVLNSTNFDKETSKGEWVVDFFAEWCGPCKISSPQFDAAAQALKGKVKFGKVDVDSQQELAERFEVMSIPSFVFIKNGEMIDKIVGAVSKDSIVDRASEAF